MLLAMSRPWKHPKTGTYYLRKRVPADLRSTIGVEIVKLTLGTKNPVEAKSRLLKALDDLEARWANMRLGEQRLTEREAHALAVRYDHVWARHLRDELSAQAAWHVNLYDRLWTAAPLNFDVARAEKARLDTLQNDIKIDLMRRFCARLADNCLRSDGLVVDMISRKKLERAIGAALQRSSELLKRQSEGYDLDDNVPAGHKFVGSRVLEALRSIGQAGGSRGARSAMDNAERLPLKELLELWWRESHPAGRKPSTYESYRNTIGYLVRFLGHDDARRVSGREPSLQSSGCPGSARSRVRASAKSRRCPARGALPTACAAGAL